MLVAYAATLCAMLCGVRIILFPVLKGGSHESLNPTLLWAVFFLTISAAGVLMTWDEDIAGRCLEVALWGTWSSPFWHFCLSRWFLVWVLYPFPSEDLRSEILPLRLRRTLRTLAFSLFAPWSGLAVPALILFRESRWKRITTHWTELQQRQVPMRVTDLRTFPHERS